jgi:hypothetical protein
MTMTMSTTKQHQKMKRRSSVTFSDDEDQVKVISRLSDSMAEISFYNEDEISMFRYEAFCAECGVDPVFDGEDCDASLVVADDATTEYFNDIIELDENASPSPVSLSSSSSVAMDTIEEVTSTHKADPMEVRADPTLDDSIALFVDAAETFENVSAASSSSSSSAAATLQVGACNHQGDTLDVTTEKPSETIQASSNSPKEKTLGSSVTPSLHPVKRRESMPCTTTTTSTTPPSKWEANRQRRRSLSGSSSEISSGLPFFVPKSTQSFYSIRGR